MRIPIKKLCTAAVLMALTVCATAFMSFPVPNMQGAYVHPGDIIIFLSVLLFGPYAAGVGGLGGFAADLIVGAGVYAPATLVIKALMALACYFIVRMKPDSFWLRLSGMAAGALVMVAGYFLYEWVLTGQLAAAALSSLFNLVQAVVGVVPAWLISPAVEKLHLV